MEAEGIGAYEARLAQVARGSWSALSVMDVMAAGEAGMQRPRSTPSPQRRKKAEQQQEDNANRAELQVYSVTLGNSPRGDSQHRGWRHGSVALTVCMQM
jgi:hypothetical protein